MTYRQLRKHLQEMQESRLDDDVTVYDMTTDEFNPVGKIKEADDKQDVLDDGHHYLTISS